MTTKFMSNMSRTFSNSGFSRTYSSAPKPFHFTKLHQGNSSTLPNPATGPKPRRDRRSSGMAVFCCCCTGCVSMLITVAIALGIAALIIWLVLRPIHTPTYDLSDITISKLLYTPTPNPTLDAAANYTIVSYNGNGKIGIKYNSIGVDTSYGGQVFNHQNIPGFYHGHRKNVTIAGNFTTTGFAMDPAKGVLLQADVGKQNVPLLIRVNVKAQLKVGVLRTPTFNVHVNCDVGIRPPTSTQPAAVLKNPALQEYDSMILVDLLLEQTADSRSEMPREEDSMQKPGHWGSDQIKGKPVCAVVCDKDDVFCDPGINQTVKE